MNEPEPTSPPIPKPADEERKRKRRNQIFFALLIAAAVGVCLCQLMMSLVDGGSSRPRATTRPQTVTVEYLVTGTGNRASLTYENASGNTEQKDVDVPWTQRYTGVTPGQFVYLSAQSSDDASRTIKCQILVDGVVVEQAESSGRYVIATCSGTAE